MSFLRWEILKACSGLFFLFLFRGEAGRGRRRGDGVVEMCFIFVDDNIFEVVVAVANFK